MLELIKASFEREGAKYHHGDSRYLLVLTENCDAALDIMQSNLLPENTVVIFGSSFPKDQEYTQVSRGCLPCNFGITMLLHPPPPPPPKKKKMKMFLCHKLFRAKLC